MAKKRAPKKTPKLTAERAKRFVSGDDELELLFDPEELIKEAKRKEKVN